MTEVVRSRRIEAGVDEVWAALADFGTIARWAGNVDHSCLMSEQPGDVGAVRRIQTGRTVLVERVTEWSPPGASTERIGLAYRIEGLPPVVRSVVNRWTVEPDGSGADQSVSNVSLASDIDAGPRPPQQLAARAIGRRFGSAGDEMLAGLDAHLTGGGGAAYDR